MDHCAKEGVASGMSIRIHVLWLWLPSENEKTNFPDSDCLTVATASLAACSHLAVGLTVQNWATEYLFDMVFGSTSKKSSENCYYKAFLVLSKVHNIIISFVTLYPLLYTYC